MTLPPTTPSTGPPISSSLLSLCTLHSHHSQPCMQLSVLSVLLDFSHLFISPIFLLFLLPFTFYFLDVVDHNHAHCRTGDTMVLKLVSLWDFCRQCDCKYEHWKTPGKMRNLVRLSCLKAQHVHLHFSLILHCSQRTGYRSEQWRMDYQCSDGGRLAHITERLCSLQSLKSLFVI